MKKPILIITVAIVLFITSCKKDDPDTGFGPDATGVDTSKGYLPVTKGTWWKLAADNLGVMDTAIQTVTGIITTINGKPYHEVTIESPGLGNQIGYLYGENHTYLSRSTSLREGVTAEFVYLVDTTSVGGTWTTSFTDDGSVNGFPSRLTGTMIEKDITKTVAGKTYKNVIHTTMNLEYNLTGSGFDSYGLYHVYIAKGVGIIQTDSFINGAQFGSSKLIDYSIK